MANQTIQNVERTITLNNDIEIPVVGIGTWNMQGAEQALAAALDAGYRHIDTAKIYGTEEAIGNAIAYSGLPREYLFITTKLWNEDQGYNSALNAIDESLEKLRLDFVDLYLVHWPTTDERSGENKREETWRAMEEIYNSKKARSIGVSNYTVEQLEEMKQYAHIPPAVNQIELHPFWTQEDVMSYCHEHNIAVTDYSPLTRAKMLDHPIIVKIAHKHTKSPAQILLRWGLQHGNIVIPKSSNPDHIQENLEIFDFELDENDMNLLDSLNENKSVLK